MKSFTMWAIVDKRGRLWRYEGCKDPVIWAAREDAKYDALKLDPKRGWKVTKVTCSVAQTKGVTE